MLMFFLSKFLNYDSLSLTFFLSFIILCLCIALSLSLSSIILCLSLCYHCVDLSHLFSLFQVELLGVIHSFYKGGPITLCCVAFIILGDNNSSVTISPPLTKDPLLLLKYSCLMYHILLNYGLKNCLIKNAKYDI